MKLSNSDRMSINDFTRMFSGDEELLNERGIIDQAQKHSKTFGRF